MFFYIDTSNNTHVIDGTRIRLSQSSAQGDLMETQVESYFEFRGTENIYTGVYQYQSGGNNNVSFTSLMFMIEYMGPL